MTSVPDPFLTPRPLAGIEWRPAASALVVYRTGCGDGVGFAHRFADPLSGQTIWVLVPADDEVGCAQETFVENLAEQVRQRDPEAVALFILWPRPTNYPEGGAYPSLIRIVFEAADRVSRVAGRTLVIDVDPDTGPTVLSDTGHRVACRFASPGWLFTSPEAFERDLAQREPLLHMDQAEITAEVVAKHPEWPLVRERSLRTTKDEWDGFVAQAKEWEQ